MKFHFNVFLIGLKSLVITSQLLYYYNHKRGIQPMFLSVFRMMSGSVSPEGVGLYRSSDVKQVMKYKKLFPLIHVISNYTNPLNAFLIVFVTFAMNENIAVTLTLGTINGIHFAFMSHYGCTIVLYQMLYFAIICKYLKLRIKNLNEALMANKRSKRSNRIPNILNAYDTLYREINHYNTTYWSKFLFFFWLFFGSLTVQLIYMSIYKVNIISVRIMMIYLWIVYDSKKSI